MKDNWKQQKCNFYEMQQVILYVKRKGEGWLEHLQRMQS
jgi:hypothetical protein